MSDASTMQPASARRPVLHVAIVIDTPLQPLWVARLLTAIRESSFASLNYVIDVPTPDHKALPVLARVHESADKRLFGTGDDGLEQRDLAPLLASVPHVRWDAPQSSTPLTSLIISPCRPPASLLEGSTPVWLLEIGGLPATDPAAGLCDFARRSDRTSAVIRDGASGSIVSEIGMARNPLSRRRGVAALARVISERLLELLESAAESGLPRPATCHSPVPPVSQTSSREVSSLAVAGSLIPLATGHLYRSLRDRTMRDEWWMAYRFGPPPELSDGFKAFHVMRPPHDRFWADPFIVERDGHHILFFEELIRREGKGTIACAEIHADGTFSSPTRVLERPYHLSYPCLFRWNGDDYMLPESSAAGTIELYRCRRFPDRWEPEAILFRDIDAVDSTIFEHEGRWWLYTSKRVEGSYDRLLLFHAESPLGPWHPHPRNPVLTDVRGGRCAGAPFRSGGRWIRAAQNGARGYGHSMVLREIVRLTPSEWEEREIGAILPGWARAQAGTHTLNVAHGVTAVDAYRWSLR